MSKLAESAEDCFWDRHSPREIKFLTLPIYDHFNRRAVHYYTVQANWNITRMLTEHAGKLLRSDIWFDPQESAEAQEQVHRLLFRLSEDVFAQLDGRGFTVYAADRAVAEATAKAWLESFAEVKAAPAPQFHLLNSTSEGVDSLSVPVTRSYLIEDHDLALHYGDDFPEWDRHLVGLLSQHDSGVSILRGPPGTGKTSYLRHLIHKLQPTHRFFCLPITQHQALCHPGMTNFWARQAAAHPGQRHIVVLEDAEALLATRHEGNRDSLANLLNVSDGLVGDFLRVQLICTVNCPLDSLDPAVTRPGRLLAGREFRRLRRDEAQRLATAKNLTLPDQADYSLAELYNSGRQLKVQFTDRRIGFAA